MAAWSKQHTFLEVVHPPVPDFFVILNLNQRWKCANYMHSKLNQVWTLNPISKKNLIYGSKAECEFVVRQFCGFSCSISKQCLCMISSLQLFEPKSVQFIENLYFLTCYKLPYILVLIYDFKMFLLVISCISDISNNKFPAPLFTAWFQSQHHPQAIPCIPDTMYTYACICSETINSLQWKDSNSFASDNRVSWNITDPF